MPDNHPDPHACMGKLNEHCQKNSLKLEYKDIAITGPPHDRVFTVAVVIGKAQYESATGKTKKEAKAQAAVLAWNTIQKQKKGEPDSYTQHKESALSPLSLSVPECTSLNSTNYVSLLNEYASKNKVLVQYNFKSKHGVDHKPIFSYECRIGDIVSAVGSGNKAQVAKSEAAKLVYEKLTSSSTFRAEESANSASDSSDATFSSSQELSSEASGTSTDLDLELKKTSNTFIQHADAIQQNETSSIQNPVSPPSQSMKPKSSTDLDLELKKTSDGFIQHADAIQQNETSSIQNPAKESANSSSDSSDTASSSQELSNETSRKKKTALAAGTRTSKFTQNERFLEDFKDIDIIGSGGFGNVFKAKNNIDSRSCAIKRIRLSGSKKDNEEREKREVKALAKLDHSHIIRYYACWEGKDIFQFPDNSVSSSMKYKCLFIQMELCEKGNLSDWLEKNPENSCKEVSIILFQQIVEGVKYIHSMDLIHRDLKPLNIFFHSENHIKIGDFGLVTDVNVDVGQRTTNIGTVSYRAPEQEGSKYDKQVDIFPLGLILYEMLSPFFTRFEKSQEWPNIKEGKFPIKFTEKFSKESSLIKELLSKKPTQRPSAAAILNILKGQPRRVHTC